MITFHTESWLKLASEAEELFKQHYAEISVDLDVPLEPNHRDFLQMDALGLLHVTVARKAGAIVGYCVVVVRQHLHYKSLLSGYYDMYWLHPAERRVPGQLVGLRMMQHAEQELRARGVKKLFAGTKLKADASAMFAKMGWVPTEVLFTKRLDRN